MNKTISKTINKTNKDDYGLLLAQAQALLADEVDPIANAANLASLIYHSVDNLNWAGFYFLKEGELVLGPFAGQLACTRIVVGKGVCGTAFELNQTLVVDDVHQFVGHIACDVASQSEIVVPFKRTKFLQKYGGYAGVLDIDSPLKSRFTEIEKDFFESLAALYAGENNS